MGQTEVILVNQFQGLDVRARHLTGSERRRLDTPRVLNNMRVDENGHLHYPQASGELIASFEPGDQILTLTYAHSPRCLLVQLTNGKIYALAFSGSTVGAPFLVATFSETGWPLWAASSPGVTLFGYAGRGNSTAGQVFKLTSTAAAATEITANEPLDGSISFSEFYKGRRFVVGRGRQVWFSNLNDFETFDANSFFTPGGDDEGTDYISTPGVVQGMAAWEDVLFIFMESSVWILTGSSPETFQLRQAMTNVGNSQPFALVRTDRGVLTYGGRNVRDYGVYSFSGNASQKISQQIDPLMKTEEGVALFGTMAFGHYILCKPGSNPVDTQIFLYNLAQDLWSTFNGWTHAAAELSHLGLFVAQANRVYLADGEELPRASDWNGRVVLGWEDEGNTAGMSRFLAVKIAGRRYIDALHTEGAAFIDVTAKVPGTDVEVNSGLIQITEDIFDNVVVPINLRGHAIELTIDVSPTTEQGDSVEVTIESIQLVRSLKDQKVSRG